LLSEVNGKNLIGLTINDKLITEKTPSEPWPGNFNYAGNKLTTLKGAPASVGGYFYCSDNKLTSFKDIRKQLKKINGTFYTHNNPLKSNVIGLLLAPGCKKVELDNKKVEEIMNRYLPNTGGFRWLLDCQEELYEARLDEWAEL